MTRKEANIEILQMLMAEVIKDPEIRFGQLLQNMDTVVEADDDWLIWLNEYYVEPEMVLKRMKLRAIINSKAGE